MDAQHLSLANRYPMIQLCVCQTALQPIELSNSMLLHHILEDETC